VDETATSKCDGFNSAISPIWQVRQQANTSQVDFALGPSARKWFRVRCLDELHQVVQFFCLDLGCQHARSEIYLSTGLLDSVTATGCCTACPVCIQRYHKDFLPVFRGSVVSFIEWLTATLKLPFRIEFKSQVSTLLMVITYWKEMIFDKASSTVSWLNVDALFLSLAATGILEIKNTAEGIMWIVGREVPVLPQQLPNSVTLIEATIGLAKYTKDSYWVGINQHPDTRICTHTSTFPAVAS
jgi:hypothetical protein